MKFIQSVKILLLCAVLLVSAVGCTSQVEDLPNDTSASETHDTEQATDTATLEQHPYYAEIVSLLNQAKQNGTLKHTTTPFSLDNDHYGAGGNVGSSREHGTGYVVAMLCTQNAYNPTSVLQTVADNGYYTVTSEEDPTTVTSSFDGIGNYSGQYRLHAVNETVVPKTYPYSFAGSKALLTDILDHCNINGERSLVADAAVKSTGNDLRLSYSEEDDCYYTYFAHYGDYITTFFNVYFKSQNGVDITDVSFEFVHMQYICGGAAGCSISLGILCDRKEAQALALVAATEKVLTGTTSFDDYQDGNLIVPQEENAWLATPVVLPSQYTIGDYAAAFSLTHYAVADPYDYLFPEYCDVYAFHITQDLDTDD